MLSEEARENFFSSFLFRGVTFGRESEQSLFEDTASFNKGDRVYSEDKFKKALGVIVSGKVRAATAESGGVTLRELSAGDTFGVAALFTEEKDYVSELSAKTKCEIVFISEEKLTSLFSLYPQTAVNYIAFLSSRVRYLNARISELSAKGADAKLYDFLLKNADESGNIAAKNMSGIASSLGIGRTSLYRALNTLRESGRIIKNGTQWKITKENK